MTSEDSSVSMLAADQNNQQSKIDPPNPETHNSSSDSPNDPITSSEHQRGGGRPPLDYPWLMNEGGFGPFVPAEKERILECRRVTDRWVTPLGCLVLLWMFYTMCQVLGVGDSRRLSHGYDYRGRLCGVDLPSDPYVYWPPHPITNTIDLISPICIRRCPRQKDVDQGMVVSYPNRTAATETLPDGREITHVTVQAVDVPAYASRKFGGEYCFPVDIEKSQILTKALGLTDEWMVVTRVFKSIQTGWFFLVISGLLAVVCSFGYLLLVADIAWIVCWVTSSMAPLCLLFGSFYLGITAATASGSSSIPALVAALDWMPVKGLLVGSAITGIIISLFLLLSDSHLKQHSRKAVALAQATSHCLWSAPNVLFYPIIGTSIAVFIWALGIVIFIGLLTSPAAIPKPHLLPNEIKLSTHLQASLNHTSLMQPLITPLPDTIHYSIVHHSDVTNDVHNKEGESSNNPSEDVYSIIRVKSTTEPRVDNHEYTTFPGQGKQIQSNSSDSNSDFREDFKAAESRRRQRRLGEGVPVEQPPSGSQFGILRQFRWDLGLHWSCLVWALSILWLLEVIHNLTQFMISLTSAMWYFTVPDIRGKRDDIGITGSCCLWVGLRYHLGTLQLSALILSTFRWLQFAAWALRQRIKSSFLDNQRQHRFCSLFLSVVQGILKSLEDTSRFLNTTGLIECVLHSNDFFPSCRRAWNLTHQQIPSIIILGRISSALSLLNSIGLASTLSGLVLYISNRFPVFHDPSSSWFVDSPAGLAAATFGLVAVIARLVVFSFDQMSSTLLYCFLVESQNQSGVVVFAPDELRVLIEEQESERRLEELQRAVPERSILSLSMMAASRGPETLDELLLSNMKGDGDSWKETIQQFRDDSGLYQEGDVDLSGRKGRNVVNSGSSSSRALIPNRSSHRQLQPIENDTSVSALEMNDVRW